MQFQTFGPDGVRTVRIPAWAAYLLGAGAFAASLALLALAATAALILLPILLLAGVVYGWWFRRKLARARRAGWPGADERAWRSSREGEVIDAEFVIIDPADTASVDKPRLTRSDSSSADGQRGR